MAVNNFDNTLKGNTVYVKDGRVDQALRKFKKKIQEDGILQELRNREFYQKPSEVRAKAKKAGRARWLKKRLLEGDIFAAPNEA